MEDANKLDIEENSVRLLVDSLKGYNINNQFSSTISIIPSELRDVSPRSYDPSVVSIGPLHHGEENLKTGEGLKKTYVCYLFDRFNLSMEQTLEECLRKVNESIHKIKECYVGMRLYSDDELSRMMVMDSCFILGFLYLESTLNVLLMQLLYRDLLLLENQIPFFVLNAIFEVTILKVQPTFSLITQLFRDILKVGNIKIFKRDITTINVEVNAIDHDHILGLLHKCYKPITPIKPENTHSSICNIVELEKAGVSFKPIQGESSKPNQDLGWPLAIEFEYSKFEWFPWFWFKPTLKMPLLNIEDGTECILRNIIAYEQTSNVDPYFTSLASAIDDLVNNGQDIAKLVGSKVMSNYLGSNEEAASMINNIGKNIILTCSFYSKQFKDVVTYYNKSWPNNIAWLRRTYFNNPWNIIALFAAIILFVLTIVQTYFTAVQTYFTVYPKK